MANATLQNPEELTTGELAGWTGYEVEALVWDHPEWDGPEGRGWDDFVSHGDWAEFQWRTPNDRIRDVSRAFEDGRMTLEEATRDPVVGTWLDDRFDSIADVLEREFEEVRELPDEKFKELALREVGASIGSEPGGATVYRDDDDRQMEDAALALDLPDWARVVTREAGGPGTSFLQALVALAPGKTLGDLEEWLGEKVRREGRPSRGRSP